MNTAARVFVYTEQNRGAGLTHRQRRRVLKKAGREPGALIVRDDGMGYPGSMQGFKALVGINPVSAPPADIIDEMNDPEA